jgi:cysteine desulfurase
MIYLDYQATTPVASEVAEAMRPWSDDRFANPHSPSRWGREAAAATEIARQQVADAIDLSGGSLAFTGGASEAINWALKGTMERIGAQRNRIITVATEHAAVLDSAEWLARQGYDLTLLPVGADGLLDLADLEATLDERLAMVAVMLVNNEIGVIQRSSPPLPSPPSPRAAAPSVSPTWAGPTSPPPPPPPEPCSGRWATRPTSVSCRCR